jgi:hypothetical protein
VNENPTADAWFYTRDGERVGPVALADLRELAESGALNPRLDMCWTQGMAEWKPAGEIDGLFKKSGNPESGAGRIAAGWQARRCRGEHVGDGT